MNEKLYIVMPAYNEAENIENVVKQWHPIVESIGVESKLVIIDDSSKDNTFEILSKLTSEYSNLIALTKPNSGHGKTCLYAYNFAISENADWIFQTDSDGQTDPNEFYQFWQIRNQFDFVIGNRNNRMDGLSRLFVTKVLSFIIILIFKIYIVDANTPFRLMKSEKLKSILHKLPINAFLANIYISILVVKYKMRLKWIPITFKERQGGVNSINFKKIFKIGLDSLKEFKQFKNTI
jgi:glycosyltransferase involved in cell wall biosynthesis